MVRVRFRIVDSATPLRRCSARVGNGDWALRWPPEALAIGKVSLPRKRHLFCEASRRKPGIDAKLLPQIALAVVGADPADIVRALDARKEWAADTCLQCRFVQCVRSTRHRDLLETGRLGRGAR